MDGKKNTFMIERIFEALMGDRVSEEDKAKVMEALEKELTEKPFRVAIIGQTGVGKTSTLNAVFGVDHYVSDVAEGTTDIIEEVFPIRDGFSLSVYDMPGLGYDIDRDEEYEKMYKKILPESDVIIYIINAHSRDLGEDCRILKEVVLPICKDNNVLDNLILAFNKIDTIGETIDPNDPELRWDVINNKPTEKLGEAIKTKLGDLTDKLISENIIGGKDAVKTDRIVFYSAIFNYNLRAFLMAITKTEKGWEFTATVGFEQIGKWSDKVMSKNE